ncbi:MAG: glycine betaine/L-proline ABC transporter ATP-binding protein [Dehalococcoidales bacterium]|nr:glycine betaine/L-proline ABC transporter ATP-binding protein [Dehalococcoidales bacterium]
MPPKIVVQNLYKVFGKSPEDAITRFENGDSREKILNETGNVLAVANVSFSVEAGEIFMVMGLSGSGKSTLVRCINRLLESTSGEIHIDGENILTTNDRRLREIRRTKMAMVFQHFALFPHRTVLENVEYGLKVRGTSRSERRQKALSTLDIVGLQEWAERPTTDLSGGMQQRVGLARALATEPDILLMDEAFSALDPLIRRDMQDQLIHLQQSMKKTILFITHDLHEALKMGDKIAVMKDGQIVQIGTPEEIVSKPADSYVEAFTLDVNRGQILSAGSLMKTAETLSLEHDSVSTATYFMRHERKDAMYVLDSSSKPVGLIKEQDLVTAIKNKVKELDKVMQTDFPQTAESTTLNLILPLCSQGVPIAVTDDNGNYKGELEPLDVLNRVAPEETDNSQNTPVKLPDEVESGIS